MKITNYLKSLAVFVTAALSLPSLAVECINAESCPNQIERLERYASEGSPEAQLLLGALLDDGALVVKNEEKAFHWFKSASAKTFNYPAANFFTGRGYLLGRGITQDLKLAKFYLKRAAKSGYPPAQQLLGLEYLNGENFPIDLYAARKLLERAANKNGAASAFYVAKMFENGLGGDKDFEKAKHFYTLSASLNFKMANKKLESLLSPEEFMAWRAHAAKSESNTSEHQQDMALSQLRNLEPSLTNIEQWLKRKKSAGFLFADRCGATCEVRPSTQIIVNRALDYASH